jgi:hypothetical protein
MAKRRLCLTAAAAAMAPWLLLPAVAQEIGEPAVPDELQIIEELPELMERRGEPTLEELLGERETEVEPGEEQRAVTGDRRTLFGQDGSVLSAPPDESPAERLLPDADDDPEVGLDPRLRAPEDDDLPTGLDIDGTIPGPETGPDGIAGQRDPVPQPPDPVAPRTGGPVGGPTGGTTGGGSGSLF